MKFNSLNEAIEVFLNSERRSAESIEAFDYILDNGPPELIEKLQEGFRKFFPDLKPDYCDDDGTPYFEISRVAEYFGLSEEEVREIPVKSDSKIISKDKLHKIQ